MTFVEKLAHIIKIKDSALCIGLDSDLDCLPSHFRPLPQPIKGFNREIIDSTSDIVCAYKLNLAFYEHFGSDGWSVLEDTIEAIPSDCLIIADGKRNDIGNSASRYAHSVFNHLSCDAVTVNPYLGRDSIEPFLDYNEKGVFILCLTSNSGSKDFQYLISSGKPLYMHIIKNVLKWNRNKNCGLVVGATHPNELQKIRKAAPKLPFLIPGIGAQGGDIEKVVQSGMNTEGDNAIINSSRAIIYASDGKDFPDAARQRAIETRDAINAARIQLYK